MYEQFYDLVERPFDLTPNPRYLLLTPGHREALSNLEYGITARKGLTVLTGDAGTGKTTLVRRVLGGGLNGTAMSRPGRFAYLANPTLQRHEFVEYLANAFGLSAAARGSKAAFLVELERVLIASRRAGELAALVVDEAQSLPDDLLEEIRLLANIESDTEKLLPLVLVGQPELEERLARHDLRQLTQRIALRCRLHPLDARQTAAYIATRIRLAGGDASTVFTRDAVLAVHSRSHGIPRLVNVICDNALLSGFALERRPVGADVIAEVAADFALGATAPAVPPVNGSELPGTDSPAAEGVPSLLGLRERPAPESVPVGVRERPGAGSDPRHR
jgi:type II secretory pathway predicted ATPase ExeA